MSPRGSATRDGAASEGVGHRQHGEMHASPQEGEGAPAPWHCTPGTCSACSGGLPWTLSATVAVAVAVTGTRDGAGKGATVLKCLDCLTMAHALRGTRIVPLATLSRGRRERAVEAAHRDVLLYYAARMGLSADTLATRCAEKIAPGPQHGTSMSGTSASPAPAFTAPPELRALYTAVGEIMLVAASCAIAGWCVEEACIAQKEATALGWLEDGDGASRSGREDEGSGSANGNSGDEGGEQQESERGTRVHSNGGNGSINGNERLVEEAAGGADPVATPSSPPGDATAGWSTTGAPTTPHDRAVAGAGNTVPPGTDASGGARAARVSPPSSAAAFSPLPFACLSPDELLAFTGWRGYFEAYDVDIDAGGGGGGEGFPATSSIPSPPSSSPSPPTSDARRPRRADATGPRNPRHRPPGSCWYLPRMCERVAMPDSAAAVAGGEVDGEHPRPVPAQPPCANGDHCSACHTASELAYHPMRYKTLRCDEGRHYEDAREGYDALAAFMCPRYHCAAEHAAYAQWRVQWMARCYTGVGGVGGGAPRARTRHSMDDEDAGGSVVATDTYRVWAGTMGHGDALAEGATAAAAAGVVDGTPRSAYTQRAITQRLLEWRARRPHAKVLHAVHWLTRRRVAPCAGTIAWGAGITYPAARATLLALLYAPVRGVPGELTLVREEGTPWRYCVVPAGMLPQIAVIRSKMPRGGPPGAEGRAYEPRDAAAPSPMRDIECCSSQKEAGPSESAPATTTTTDKQQLNLDLTHPLGVLGGRGHPRRAVGGGAPAFSDIVDVAKAPPPERVPADVVRWLKEREAAGQDPMFRKTPPKCISDVDSPTVWQSRTTAAPPAGTTHMHMRGGPGAVRSESGWKNIHGLFTVVADIAERLAGRRLERPCWDAGAYASWVRSATSDSDSSTPSPTPRVDDTEERGRGSARHHRVTSTAAGADVPPAADDGTWSALEVDCVAADPVPREHVAGGAAGSSVHGATQREVAEGRDGDGTPLSWSLPLPDLDVDGLRAFATECIKSVTGVHDPLETPASFAQKLAARAQVEALVRLGVLTCGECRRYLPTAATEDPGRLVVSVFGSSAQGLAEEGAADLDLSIGYRVIGTAPSTTTGAPPPRPADPARLAPGGVPWPRKSDEVGFLAALCRVVMQQMSAASTPRGGSAPAHPRTSQWSPFLQPDDGGRESESRGGEAEGSVVPLDDDNRPRTSTVCARTRARVPIIAYAPTPALPAYAASSAEPRTVYVVLPRWSGTDDTRRGAHSTVDGASWARGQYTHCDDDVVHGTHRDDGDAYSGDESGGYDEDADDNSGGPYRRGSDGYSDPAGGGAEAWGDDNDDDWDEEVAAGPGSSLPAGEWGGGDDYGGAYDDRAWAEVEDGEEEQERWRGLDLWGDDDEDEGGRGGVLDRSAVDDADTDADADADTAAAALQDALNAYPGGVQRVRSISSSSASHIFAIEFMTEVQAVAAVAAVSLLNGGSRSRFRSGADDDDDARLRASPWTTASCSGTHRATSVPRVLLCATAVFSGVWTGTWHLPLMFHIPFDLSARFTGPRGTQYIRDTIVRNPQWQGYLLLVKQWGKASGVVVPMGEYKMLSSYALVVMAVDFLARFCKARTLPFDYVDPADVVLTAQDGISGSSSPPPSTLNFLDVASADTGPAVHAFLRHYLQFAYGSRAIVLPSRRLAQGHHQHACKLRWRGEGDDGAGSYFSTAPRDDPPTTYTNGHAGRAILATTQRSPGLETEAYVTKAAWEWSRESREATSLWRDVVAIADPMESGTNVARTLTTRHVAWLHDRLYLTLRVISATGALPRGPAAYPLIDARDTQDPTAPLHGASDATALRVAAGLLCGGGASPGALIRCGASRQHTSSPLRWWVDADTLTRAHP